MPDASKPHSVTYADAGVDISSGDRAKERIKFLAQKTQREITERRRAEEALLEVNATLEQQVAERTAKACLLLPGPPDVIGRAAELAGLAVDRGAGDAGLLPRAAAATRSALPAF